MIRIITVERFGKRDLIVFGRKPNGERYIEKIRDFLPYFYDDKKNKIVVDSPGQVPDMRSLYPKTYEADILYPQRFLIDRYTIPLKEEPLRICYLDIETNDSLDTETTPEPIICITCYDNFLKKYITFVWREDLEPKKEDRVSDWSVYYFNNEKEMILKFVDFIKDTDPDVFTGWNVDRFDMKYIINRMKVLHANFYALSRLRRVTIREGFYAGRPMFDIYIAGRTVIDLLMTYKVLTQSELSSYSLDYVAKVEKLGVQKTESHFEKGMWQDLDRLLKYNRADVEITMLLDERRFLVRSHNSRRITTGCIWQFTKYFSKANDVRHLRKAKEMGMLLPTRRDVSEEEKKKKVGGGFVLNVTPGVHKWVFVFDLKTLYPNLIRQCNISFETLTQNGDIKLGNKYNNQYNSEPKGLIPLVLQDMMGERDEIKKKMIEEGKKNGIKTQLYKALYGYQFTLKNQTNATYGAFNNPGSRLYNPEIADSITWLGRETVKWTKKAIEEYSFIEDVEVIYSDTDSCFVATHTDNIEDVKKIMVELQDVVNKSYDELLQRFGCKKNDFLYNRAEKVYSRIFFSTKIGGKGAKKRYAGTLVWNDGYPVNEFKTTGFESKKSNFNKYGSKLMNDVFKMVLADKTKQEVKQYIVEQKEKMVDAPISDIAIPITLGKNLDKYEKEGPYVRGSKYANEHLGEDFKIGHKVRYIYVNGIKGKPLTDVISYSNEPPEGIQVNWDKMIDLTITKKMDRIFEALGWVPKEKSLKTFIVKKNENVEK